MTKQSMEALGEETSQNQEKYCSRCGKQIDNPYGVCTSCSDGPSFENTASVENKPFTKAYVARMIIFVLFAIFVLVSFETAANLIAAGGEGISDISSVGGRTLEEAYYHELGFVYEGISLSVRTFGRVVAVILTYIGGKK